jgi:hypothetical protein
MLRDLGGGQFDPAGHLADLIRLAPDTVTAFFTGVANAKRQGSSPVASENDVRRLTIELLARGAPPDIVEVMRVRFRSVASPDHPVYLRMGEAGVYADFDVRLSGHLRAALERRVAIEAAFRFDYHGAKSLDRQLVGNLVRRDREAVARLILSTASDHERAVAYAEERVRQGETFGAALRDGYALVAAVKLTEFGTVRDRVADLLTQTDRSSAALAELIRNQPDRLLNLAWSSPQQLTEFYADLLFKSRVNGDVAPLTASRLAEYIRHRMRSNILPVASEMSVVFSLHEMGMTLLKSDPAMRGGANREGIDIVAFGRLNGIHPATGPVRVMIADDKALQMRDFMGIHELQDVSAMTGPRFARNLRASAAEIEAQIWRIVNTPGLSEFPEYVEYLAGARAAVQQMIRAARAIERLPVPGREPQRTARIRSEAYTRAVARILEWQNISQVVTSRHGNVNELARWLRSQGFLLEDEYLRRLAAAIAFGGVQ